MPDRSTLRHVDQALRPLARRVANTVGRAVVFLVRDGGKRQLLQLGVLKGETRSGGEHMQPYGFSSVPLAGAEAVVLFPNGDRGRPLVISVADRRHRPTGGKAGEVTVYSHTGAKVTLKANGDITAEPGDGGKIILAGADTTPGPTGEGVVVGTGIDPFTGQTYNVLQNASSKVFAKK